MPLYAVSRRSLSFAVALALTTAASLASAAKPQVDLEDHFEFDAILSAPYLARADHTRDFAMEFRFPGANDGTMVVWRLDVLDNTGAAVRTWRGESKLTNGLGTTNVNWSEFDPQNGPLSYGFYKTRLQAYALDNYSERLGYGTLAQRVDGALKANGAEVVDQEWEIQVGSMPAPSMPAFDRLPVGAGVHTHATSASATGGLPYTVYLGNLHSQTNLSDGGGDVSTCNSEQPPQSANGGTPTVAYTYAMNHGLDFLMTSEHNHMFDGSTGTNASADPTTAKNLFQSGQTMRDNFNAAHSNFLALAGLEWGVISNGGHMNVFNVNKLVEWEYNSSNQLIGDVFVAKSDYAGMYTTMKANGWIGQFNHPASTGQFTIGGTDLAYTADGDSVMVLCEIMNSSAFSSKTDETQGAGGGYAAACNKLLEAGYHVAFSSDQDNHCANWGASYTNRTGVLIPNGQALNQTNFLAALQARHVFATWDKTAQLILTTSGGHIMGDQFNNSGSLTLTINYAPGTGRSASQTQIYEGVPGSNGTVALTSSTAVTTITPANGQHFYYAKVTQDDGTQLYSAPVWVNQGAGGGDTTPPTVSASESGTSGTITLSATASDNVGVSKVEFYVDNSLVNTDTTSPYSATMDSTTLANGSHNLVAKAYDAAGNIGTSSTVAFSVSNSTPDTTPPTVSASESGTSGTITLSATASDNVGVTKVEFYIDGTLNATDTTSPYSTTVDSTTLANGSHNLVAKAYDAAGNVGTSSTVAFSVSNTTGSNVLQNGVGITIDDATAGHQQNWTMAVPAGATNLVFSMSGGTGDADMYVKFGSAPTTSTYDCRPYVTGNAESCPITTAQAGTYYVMVNAYAAYSGVTLKGSYTAPGSGGTPTANFSCTMSSLTATCTDSSTDAGGTIGSHSWTFGDGGTSTATSPSHTYAAAGTYTVTETVTDSVNGTTSSKSASVTATAPSSTQLLANTGFESTASWTGSTGVICATGCTGESAHAGSGFAWLDGYGAATTDTLSQTVNIPSGATTGTLTFYLHVDTAETSTTTAYDKLTVTVGTSTVATFSNLDAATGYQVHSYNVDVTGALTRTIKFSGVEDSQKQTSFVIDDVTFTAQ